MTGNVRDNRYPHIRLLPTPPHLASADFIRLLPVATSADPLITRSLQQQLRRLRYAVVPIAESRNTNLMQICSVIQKPL